MSCCGFYCNYIKMMVSSFWCDLSKQSQRSNPCLPACAFLFLEHVPVPVPVPVHVPLSVPVLDVLSQNSLSWENLNLLGKPVYNEKTMELQIFSFTEWACGSINLLLFYGQTPTKNSCLAIAQMKLAVTLMKWRYIETGFSLVNNKILGIRMLLVFIYFI